VLLLVLAGLLMLEARSTGPVLPVSDPVRFGPMSLRVVVALLGLQIFIAFLARLLPSLTPRSARARDLVSEESFESREALDDLGADIELDAMLEESGLTSRRTGQRRAFGVRGRAVVVGLTLAGLGAALLLVALTISLDDPASGELTLVEGENVETIEYAGGATQPLRVFLGYRFSVTGVDGLIRGIESGDGEAQLRVEASDGTVETLVLRPGSPIGLADGTWLTLEAVREIARPFKARIRVVPPDAGSDTVAPRTLRAGETIEIGSAVLQVSNLRHDVLGLGPAIELTPASGRPFWVFQSAPGLAAGWPHLEGHRVEIDAIQAGYVLSLERFRPQDPTLVVAGLVLLLLGTLLCVSTVHFEVYLEDEVDRVVAHGVSLNDATHVMATLEEVTRAAAAAIVRHDPERDADRSASGAADETDVAADESVDETDGAADENPVEEAGADGASDDEEEADGETAVDDETDGEHQADDETNGQDDRETNDSSKDSHETDGIGETIEDDELGADASGEREESS